MMTMITLKYIIAYTEQDFTAKMQDPDLETLFWIRMRGVETIRIRPDPATTLLPTVLYAPCLSVLSEDIGYCRKSYYKQLFVKEHNVKSQISEDPSFIHNSFVSNISCDQ